jgi:hypothetical protein
MPLVGVAGYLSIECETGPEPLLQGIWPSGKADVARIYGFGNSNVLGEPGKWESVPGYFTEMVCDWPSRSV